MFRSRGFTLLEVLVAVAISAAVGVAAVQLLSNVANVGKSSEERADEVAALQRWNQILSRDISQLINREIRDQYGDPLPSLMVGSGDYPLEFTLSGWRNRPTTEDPRSTLQRVAYRSEPMDSEPCTPARERLALMDGVDEYDYETDLECLVRYYWHVLDRGDNSEPSTQVIYDQVSDFEVELVVSLPALNGQDSPPELSSSDYWPPLTPDEGQRPVAIVVRTEMPAFGNIVRQWPIAHD